MSPSLLLLIFLGGFIGAVIRDWVIHLWRKRSNRFWGTCFVNITGSFLLGFCSQAIDSSSPLFLLIIGTGLIGSYTTFSTYSADAFMLWRRSKLCFFIYAAGTVILSIIFFWIGTLIS
ncbi:camphor resistance protein CrcB [Bacillus oleivorans]|uniref:Fluoride-specific ion channel FluC n=1 Tax=Bacillus oleivorans TaxID=1448271 RepID=A0A285D255_9BACI|nr:CrcB family protein [Bacillus oleivorans]SNX73907.1 camphor resistance protein CrcB [Bacillus oleivorans]